MKRSLRIASMVLASLLFFSYNSLKAQVKIGGNPAIIDPNALLELESNRKGLLLPRLDENGFNTLTAADATVGMVVYYTGTAFQGKGLYVKQQTGTGSDKWLKIAGADITDGVWKITGNSAINPANHFLGTTDAQPLIVKTSNVERLRVRDDGTFILDLTGIADEPTENQVLLIASDGTIKRKNLDLNVVKSLSGLKGDLSLLLTADEVQEGVDVDSTNSPNLSLKLPILTGASATQTYGFMKYEDWVKLDNLIRGGITLGTLLTDGSQGADGATIVPDNQGHYTITLGEATAAAPGLVGIGAQSFKGIKTFEDEIIIGANGGTGNLTVNGNHNILGTLDFAVNAYVPGTPPTSYNLLIQDATTVKSIVLPAWKLDAGVASVNGVKGTTTDGDLTFDLGTAGTAPAIVNDGPGNKITLNLPDASELNTRGLVTNTAQTFAGGKSFSNSVTVNSATAGTSSLSVNGSIGVKFTRVNADHTAAVDDYMILVKPTGSTNLTVTLPDPSTCSGRVYIVKREAKAYPIDELQEDFSVVIASAGGTGKFHGENTTPLTVPNTTLHVMSDGTNWQILSRGSGF